METSEFTSFLNEEAASLEKIRFQKSKAFKTYTNTIGLGITVFRILAFGSIAVAIFLPPLFILTIVLFIIEAFLKARTNPEEEFIEYYKEETLPNIFSRINSTFEYSPYYFNEDNLFDSKILKSNFLNNNTKLVGEDYIKGKIKDVDIECNELHFYRIERKWWKVVLMLVFSVIAVPILFIVSLATSGELELVILWFRIANKEVLFFKGFLMVADFHKTFTSELILIPKNQKAIPDQLHFNLSSNPYKKIELENDEVNKRYTIYASNERESFYILSTTMLEAIEELSNSSKQLPVFSFVDGKMNMLIPKPHDSFEFSIHEEIKDGDHFNTVIRDIQILPRLIERFKLNEKLWSKH